MRMTTDSSGQRVPELPLLNRIDKVTAELKLIHGRKALVLFTGESIAFGGGTPLGRLPVRPPNTEDRQYQQTIDNCNQANVAIYGFHTNPNVPVVEGDWYTRTRSQVQPHDEHGYRIHDLANRTGGKYGTLGSNQLASYLGAIATQSDYYLLGYTPSANSTTNCHKLKVTVARKGLDIDARDTYCASGIPDSSLKAPQRALEAQLQTGATGTIPVTIQTTWFYLKRGTAVANVAMNIGPAAMQSKGKLHGEIPVLGVAYRADGSVAARFSDTIDLNFETQSDLDDFRKTPYPYSNQLRLPPGSYRIRVIAGTTAKTYGSAERPGRSCAMGRRDAHRQRHRVRRSRHPDRQRNHRSRSRAAGRRVQPRLPGTRVHPDGKREFHWKQQGLLYFEIYEPGPKPPVIELSIGGRA